MFLSKGYRGIYYLYFEDHHTGRRRKTSTGTKNKSEATKFMHSFDKKANTKTKSIPIAIKSISSIQSEVLQYARTNFSNTTLIMYGAAIRNMLKIIGDIFP